MIIDRQTVLTGTLALTTLLWLSSSHAEIYQWTDEKGRKHFSQTPPPSGQYSQKEIKVSPPADQAAAKARLDKLREQRKKAQAEKQQQKEAAQRQASKAKQRQRNCDNARQHLQGLELRPRVLLRNPDDGSVTRLTEEERQQRIDQAKEQIKEYCD